MSTDPDVHPKQLIENIRAELAELEAVLDKGEPLRNLTGFTWTVMNFATILNEQAEEAEFKWFGTQTTANVSKSGASIITFQTQYIKE